MKFNKKFFGIKFHKCEFSTVSYIIPTEKFLKILADLFSKKHPNWNSQKETQYLATSLKPLIQKRLQNLVPPQSFLNTLKALNSRLMSNNRLYFEICWKYESAKNITRVLTTPVHGRSSRPSTPYRGNTQHYNLMWWTHASPRVTKNHHSNHHLQAQSHPLPHLAFDARFQHASIQH